ncbi:3-phosphoshikimate 1-carboxyvinyltransferase [Gardnerella vaginalis]|uniref:3-phosphoshikimate 1-carboxyvinyltransferase n=1 Tax=Gardnerella vaginalis JCP8108 TaxID=1261066 RepID=S4GIE9_GARVA|nr:3-phosphoshikimate 1-carboxyvinyltransferase [Gardnerella vaginalis]EPI48944.1 3-phosphoshikimate 1-carboxyvinyltransferase [Gardnerella vaginalis JCP8108]
MCEVMNSDSQEHVDLWKAPFVKDNLDALVEIPGSKSLSNRYLILAALGSKPVVLKGLLRSRDTELMMSALKIFGVRFEEMESYTSVLVIPPHGNTFDIADGAVVNCGLAGTVMRFVTALSLFANKPIRFDGDKQAYARPMKPVLDGLGQLGAHVKYHGEVGFLPFSIIPPKNFGSYEINDQQTTHQNHVVRIDSSSSSQFISALLLIASRIPGGLCIEHIGSKLPSMPHIRMTMEYIRKAGGVVDMPESGVWHVKEHDLTLPDEVVVEPDLSNAAPFIGAALIAGGCVKIPNWPFETTQPGGLLPRILEQMGAEVFLEHESLNSGVLCVRSNESIKAISNLDLSAAGEITPSIAAMLAFADGVSELHGIAHLRGHETNRLDAIVTELKRVGIGAEELDDGIRIIPSKNMHGEVMETYADHRMATFASMLGLRIPNITVKNIATTRKTIPDFPGMWCKMISK